MPWLAAIPAIIGSVGSAVGGAAASAGGALASGASALGGALGSGASTIGGALSSVPGAVGGGAQALGGAFMGGAQKLGSLAGQAGGAVTESFGGAAPDFGAGAEAAKISGLGQPVPEGVSFAGPSTPVSAPEASQMFNLRPGLPSSEVATQVPPSFSTGGPAGNKLAGMLEGITKTAEQFNPILQMLSMMQGGSQGASQDLSGTAGGLPLPNFEPVPAQVQEDPLAFLRAFNVQG